MPDPTPLLISAPPGGRTDDVHALAAAAGFAAVGHALGAVPAVDFAPLAAAVVCPAEHLDAAVAQTTRWRVELGDRFVPVVWVVDAAAAVRAALAAGADAALVRPLDAALFAAQLHALGRIRDATRRGDEGQYVARRLHAAFEQIDRDRALVRTLHQALSPAAWPPTPGLAVGVFADALGGCFVGTWPAGYDREFFLADADGVFGLFLKQALAAACVRGPAGAVPPGDVLRRVNRDLLALRLDAPPLAAAGLLRVEPTSGRVSFARAGVLNPIHVPAAGAVDAWATPGPFLGVFEAEFPTLTRELAVGDKLLLANDGAVPRTADGVADAAVLVELAAAHRHRPAADFAAAVGDALNHRVGAGPGGALLVVERSAEPLTGRPALLS